MVSSEEVRVVHILSPIFVVGRCVSVTRGRYLNFSNMIPLLPVLAHRSSHRIFDEGMELSTTASATICLARDTIAAYRSSFLLLISSCCENVLFRSVLRRLPANASRLCWECPLFHHLKNVTSKYLGFFWGLWRFFTGKGHRETFRPLRAFL